MLLIGGLLTSIILPNFGALQTHKLRNSAERVVERIDFGRQRAVMTGVPHRLAIDLDESSYKLEWESGGSSKKTPEPKVDSDDQEKPEPKLSLAPPAEEKRIFVPVPGPLGEVEYLSNGVEFGWIETPGGEIDFGEAFITFEADGTSTYTVLILDEPGGRELALEILPLAESVRILDEES